MTTGNLDQPTTGAQETHPNPSDAIAYLKDIGDHAARAIELIGMNPAKTKDGYPEIEGSDVHELSWIAGQIASSTKFAIDTLKPEGEADEPPPFDPAEPPTPSGTTMDPVKRGTSLTYAGLEDIRDGLRSIQDHVMAVIGAPDSIAAHEEIRHLCSDITETRALADRAVTDVKALFEAVKPKREAPTEAPPTETTQQTVRRLIAEEVGDIPAALAHISEAKKCMAQMREFLAESSDECPLAGNELHEASWLALRVDDRLSCADMELRVDEKKPEGSTDG